MSDFETTIDAVEELTRRPAVSAYLLLPLRFQAEARAALSKPRQQGETAPDGIAAPMPTAVSA